MIWGSDPEARGGREADGHRGTQGCGQPWPGHAARADPRGPVPRAASGLSKITVAGSLDSLGPRPPPTAQKLLPRGLGLSLPRVTFLTSSKARRGAPCGGHTCCVPCRVLCWEHLAEIVVPLSVPTHTPTLTSQGHLLPPSSQLPADGSVITVGHCAALERQGGCEGRLGAP